MFELHRFTHSPVRMNCEVVVATEWYYASDGQQHGPVTSAELRRMAGAGQLRRDDLLWKEGMPEWIIANDIQNLFSSAVSPSVVPMAQARSEISYECPHCGANLRVDTSLAGSDAICAVCKERTIVPKRVFTQERVATASQPRHLQTPVDNRSGLTIPVLISAITNVVVGLI